jgi:Protein of unknown function (DUF4238)
VIEKIRQGGLIGETERMHLTYYLATMMRRVPVARSRAMKLVPAVMKGLIEEFRGLVERALRERRIDEALANQRRAEIAAWEEKHDDNPPDEVITQVRSPWPSKSILEVIFNMYWRVLRCAGPSFFLASDNPAHFFEGLGLGHRDCEVILPLCRDQLLHCSWQGSADVVFDETDERTVKELNRRMASGAERFVFYHRNADWVLKCAQNTIEQCNRINWVPRKNRR